MIIKWIFNRVVALIGLLVQWPVLLIVAILVKVKMAGGPAFFVQKRVGVSKPTATRLLQKLDIVLELVGHCVGSCYRIRNY